MKKILFLSPYPVDKAPSQRLKYEQYYKHIEEAGFVISTQSFMNDDFWEIVYKSGNTISKIHQTLLAYIKRIWTILFSVRQYDIIYIHLWVVPFGPPVFEWLTSLFARKIVYDIDDLIYLKPKNKVNKLSALFKSSRNSIFLMKKADHVVTCTPHLDQFVRQYNEKTTDISSTINTDIYLPKTNYSFQEEKPILGWSGSFSTSKYVYLLKDVFFRLKEEFDFKLLVMGDETFHIEGLDVEAIPWKESYEVKTIKKFDIGLYPLPNEEWVLGKSGLKALQYMSLGIPTVATAIGANFRVIKNGHSGFLVENEEEWYERLSLLLKDQELRRSIGQEAILKVEREYSINANKATYLSILEEVMAS